MEVNYRRFYHIIKRRYPHIAAQVNVPGVLKSPDQVMELYIKYQKLYLAADVKMCNIDTRLVFIAVIAKMDNPLFLDYIAPKGAGPLTKGLAVELGRVLGCERTVISHSLRTVKNYMEVYPEFRARVEYFYGKMIEGE